MKKIDTFQTFARGAKSLVAILLVMLMAVGNLFADQVTFTFSAQGYGNSEAVTGATINDYLSFTCAQGSNNNPPKYYNTGEALRLYGGNSLTITATDAAITGIEFTFASGEGTNAITANEGTYGSGSWTGDATSIIFTIGGTTGHRRVQSFTITYTPSSTPSAVAAPTMTPASGTYYEAQSVALATTTEGATIHYTLDGSEPTASSALYQDPISVTTTTTIKAIAVLGENTSAVVSATYTIPMVTNIAAFKALPDGSTIYQISGDVVVLGQYTSRLFVQDETGALLIYGNYLNNNYDYQPGDVISGGVYGSRSTYYGLNEMNVSTTDQYAVGVPGTPVEPTVHTVAELIANYNTYETQLVTIENVVVTEDHIFASNNTEGKSASVTQDDNTIVIFNAWQALNGVEVEAGDALNVTGFLMVNGDTYQIAPRDDEDIVPYVAPVEPLPVEAIAEVPYFYNFDEGEDPYFMIENGDYTNKWYVGLAQVFDNNKLYISGNGNTNKYNITAASTVTAYRDVMIPEEGAVLSFDYHVNGELSSYGTYYDYLKVELIQNETATEIAKLANQNEWTTFSYTIPSDMAGVVRVKFTWTNDGSAGNQFPAAIDNISVDNIPVITCEQPSNLNAEVEVTTATITWEAAEGQTAWIMEYMAEGETEWTVVDVNETSYALNDLAELTHYSVRVKANCGTDGLSEAITTEFTTGSTCPTVSNLQYTIEMNTTTLTWDAAEGQTSWKVQFKPTEANDDAWITIPVNTDPTTTFGGLQGSTYYDVRVIAICGENQSEGTSLTFRSGCAPFDVLDQTFASSTIPDCWTSEEFSFQSENGAFTNVEGAWLLSPAVNIPNVGTTYLTIKGSVVSGTAEYAVLASYQGTRADLFTEIYNGTLTPSADEVIIPLTDNYFRGRAVNFKIVSNDAQYKFFETVKVNQCPFTATNLTASNVTGTTVHVAWEADEAVTSFQVQANEQTWDIENATEATLEGLDYNTAYTIQVRVNCGNGNYGEGSNTVNVTTKPACSQPTNLHLSEITANGNYFFEWTASEWTVDNNTKYVLGYKAAGETEYIENDWVLTTSGYLYIVDQLQYNTTYTVAVKAVCSEEYSSEWSNTVTIKTPCEPMELPYTEDFNSYSGNSTSASAPSGYPNHTMPECWAFKMSTSTSTYPQIFLSTNSGYPVSGNCLFFKSSNTTPAYAVLPQFSEDLQNILIKFTYRNEGTTASNGTLYLGYMTDPTNPSTFVEVYTCPQTTTKTEVEYAFEQTSATGSNYYIAFRYTGGSSNNYYAAIDNISVVKAPTCFTPSIEVNGTTLIATITPGNGGNPAQSYDLQIGNQIVPNVTVSSENTVDLVAAGFTFEPNTEYEINVRANCGGDDYSEWMNEPASFTTACTAMNLPYTEDFESYTVPSYYYYEGVMPECWDDNWTAVATSSSNHYEPKVTDYSSYRPGSDKYLYLHAGSSTSTYTYYQNPTIVILPSFNENLTNTMISFRARVSSPTNGTLYLGYVNGEGVFTSLKSLTCGTTANAEIQTVMLNDNYEIPADVRLAFMANNTATSSYSTFMVGIDDITVKLIPTCGTPTVNVSGTNITVASTIGTPESYDLQIGNEIVPVIGTSFNLIDYFTLEPNTDYEVSVRANCGGGDLSEWSDPVSFRTPCSAQDLPYNEGFENGALECWSNDGAGSWSVATGDYSTSTGSHTGSYNAKINHSTTGNATKLVSPTFNVTSTTVLQLGFWLVNRSWSGDIDELRVYAKTSATGEWQQVYETTEAHSTWTEISNINLPAGTMQIAFEMTDNYGYGVGIDDITVEQIPTCGKPSVSLNGTIVTITPNDLGTPESYDLQIGNEIVPGVTETSFDLNDYFTLASNTAYEVSVRANCGGGDFSAWTASIPFNTPCSTQDLPYIEEFENGALGCWSNDGAGSWSVGTGDYSTSTGSHTGSYNAKITHSTSGSATKLVSPAFNVTPSTVLQLGFWLVNRSWSGDIDELRVYARTSVTGEWQQVYETTEAHSTWTEISDVILPTGTMQIAFEMTDSYGYGVGIDDITVEIAPTCFVPENFTVSDIHDNSAVLTWEVNSSNPEAVSYVVEYKTQEEETWQTVPVSELTYTLSGLTASTDYMVRVKTDCGNGDNSKYATAEFTTLCPFGYYENSQLVCPEAEDFRAIAINSYLPACDVDNQITITVKNLGYEGSVNAFTAYYQINDQEVVSENVNPTTPLAFLDETTYTFTTPAVYESGDNVINAWVIAGTNEEVNMVSTTVTILNPIAIPYEENFDGLIVNKGWNAIDANEDGITMALNNNINYSFNDEVDADDWMISPCIEMTAGTYTIIYEYKANSSLTESFELFFGENANSLTNLVATHTFNNTTAQTATATIDIPVDGTYNFGFHATSLRGNLGFSIDNFKVYPVNNVVVTYAEQGGTVTPNGIIPVNYHDNLTLGITLDQTYHLGGIEVDGHQVVPEDATGANFMLYTIEDVTAPHTIFVDFKLKFYINKTVENYNHAYTDTCGEFVPAAPDTTMNPDPVTVNMVAKPHYHLYKLTQNTEDVTEGVDNHNDGTYSYTIESLVVANYNMNAIFRRDTVDINYNVLTGKGSVDNSQVLNTGDAYTTWVDYSVNHDVNHTSTFAAADNYYIVKVFVNGEDKDQINSWTFEDVTETQNVDLKFGYKVDAFVSNSNTYGDIDLTDAQGTINPPTQYIAEFEPMTVEGTVAEHYHLYQLLVNGVDRISEVVFTDDHNYTFTMNSVDDNYTIEAVVKVDTFAITYNVVNGQGYVEGQGHMGGMEISDASGLMVAPATHAHVFNYGDDWFSTITPDTGFIINNVTLDGENLYATSDYRFNFIDGSHVFDIDFAPVTYTITTNAFGHGTVTDGRTFTYDPENHVDYEFTAAAEEGYYISSVMINDVPMDLTDVTDTFTTTISNVSDNYIINVIFQMYTYTMTANATTVGGTITPSGTQVVNYNSDVTYEIAAEEGYYIYELTVDTAHSQYTQADDNTTETISFNNITENHEVSVSFLPYMYRIIATTNGDEHGSINGYLEIDTTDIQYGQSITYTFDADANYQVYNVIIDGLDMGAITSYEFIHVVANHTIEVSFEPITYVLQATSNVESCTITPADTNIDAGQSITYTVTAAEGYHLEVLTINGEVYSVPASTFTIDDVQGDLVIYAIFAQNNVTVTVEQPDHATITPGTMTYTYGATPTYTIVPAVGYDIESVTVDNVEVDFTYANGIATLTLDTLRNNVTLTATTAIKTFTITVTQGEHGEIAPSTVTVEYGSDTTFTITPDDYYVTVDVKVDGSSRGALTEYTFHNVTSNHTITAVFAADCQLPTNLAAYDIDTTSAMLKWQGTATSYEVRYKAAGAANYTTQTVNNATTLELTGLTPNTLYSWGVRSLCGTELSSEWVNNAFTTKAVPAVPVDPSSIANADLANVKVYSYQNNVYIVNEEGVAISNVDIYDIYGKQVYTGKVVSSPEIISLNVTNGNYIVRLATVNGVGVYKVAIVR